MAGSSNGRILGSLPGECGSNPQPATIDSGRINQFLTKGCFMEVTSTMSTLISSFGEVATAIFQQVSQIADTIVETPLLLFTTGFLFLGGCVGIFGRLLSRN